MVTQALLLVLSAFAGAAVAIGLKTYLRYLRKKNVESNPITTYDCADSSRRKVGALRHGFGCAVPDNLATRQTAWEHSLNVFEPNHVHTIFGPYVNDFGKPGSYRVVFKIRGTGFPQTDDPAIFLDIVKAPTFQGEARTVLGQLIVRAKDLNMEFTEYELYCYAAGSGTYEYRCFVDEDTFGDGQGKLLRFDTVSVYAHISFWELF